MKWISVEDSLPNNETPVLIVQNGVIRIGELRWEHPTYDDYFDAYRYWDDPEDDGQDWEWNSITYWQPLPSLPDEVQSTITQDLHNNTQDDIVQEYGFKTA